MVKLGVKSRRCCAKASAYCFGSGSDRFPAPSVAPTSRAHKTGPGELGQDPIKI